jgi:hypothetical protein
MSKLIKLPDWIFKYLGAAILILVPLYPKFPLISVSGTFVSIRLEDLLIALSAVLIGLAYLPKLKSLGKNKINSAVFIYLGVGILSVLSASFITKTVEPKIAALHWARRIEYLIPFFLGLEIVSRKIKPSFYLKILLMVIFFAFLYGIGQRYFEWPIVITQNEEYSRGLALRYIPGSHINSTFAGHYDLASFLVLLLPVVTCMFFVIKEKWSKLAVLLVYFSGMWLLVNTASRISLASFIFAVSSALFFLKKYKTIIPVVIVSLGFVVFSSNLLLRYSRIVDVVKDKLGRVPPITINAFAADELILRRERATPTPTPMPILEDRSSNIRLNVEWPRAMRAFYKNPLLGTGYSSITLASDNDYLRALGETGILGFFAFLLIFLRISIRFLKSLPFTKNFSKENLALVAGLFGGLMGLFINAMFIDIFEASKLAIIFWFFIGITIKSLEKRRYG